jgi:hypothetical protein
MRNFTQDWWEDETPVLRFVSDLLASELAQARPGLDHRLGVGSGQIAGI